MAKPPPGDTIPPEMPDASLGSGRCAVNKWNPWLRKEKCITWRDWYLLFLYVGRARPKRPAQRSLRPNPYLGRGVGSSSRLQTGEPSSRQGPLSRPPSVSPSRVARRTLTPSPFGTRRWMRFGPSSSRDGSNRQAGRRTVRLAENLVEDQATKIVLVCSADLTVNFASQKIVGISTAHCLYQTWGT